MAVSHVSPSEIQMLRENGLVINNYPAKKAKKISPSTRYTDQISDRKIVTFFTPYGYIDHERNDEDGSIFVYCNDCQIIFNDFTVLVAPIDNEYLPVDLKFYDQFANLCEEANITPSQAIADKLEEEIFNPMPYYVERKKAFTQNNLNRIANSQVYGNLLKASIEKQKHRENLASLNKTYGSSDPEQIADTLARLNPNK